MPQLDHLIIQSQVNVIILFFIGYFIFLKYLLPIISFILKIKHKLIISNLNWFNNNFSLLVVYNKNYISSCFKLVNLFSIINYLKSKKFIFFNLYSFDYLLIKNILKKKNKQ